MVSVYRSRMDHHLPADCNLAYQLACPRSDIPSKHPVPVLRGPDDVLLEIPHRVATALVALHALKLPHFALTQYCLRIPAKLITHSGPR